MATHVIPTVAEARAAANAWLMDHLPDRFAAGIPSYDALHQGWRIPVWLAYPGLTPLGPVGELLVDAVSGDIQAHTPLTQMKTQALHLYDQHRAAIDAPFHKQETRYSCAPACLPMVLEALGQPMKEAALRLLTDCSPLGTDAFHVVEAARQLGFLRSRKYTLASLEELAVMLAAGHFPIVYADMWPLQGGLSGQYHALVAINLDPEQVTVLDPQHGERQFPREDFQEAWSAMRFLTMMIAA